MSKAQVEQSIKLKKSYRNIRLYEIEQVREGTLGYENVTSPEALFRIASSIIGKKDREHFLVISLSTKNEVIGTHVVSVGSLMSTIVRPPEVFKFLLMTNAASFVVAHNHPSGILTPSKEDVDVTYRLAEVGNVMGIKLIDHLIVSNDWYYSMMEHGEFDSKGV